MQEYLKVSLMLSVFGLLKEARPSEPFLTNFIVDFKNIDLETIYQDIFPIGTYSYLAQLVVVFLVTDLLRYKPLIILLSGCGVAIWSILLWGNSVLSVQIVETIYGTYCATEIAYFAYIYAKTDKQHFQAVTSHTRAAIFFGRFLAAISAQILDNFGLMDYRQLNYLTLIAQLLALCWAFLIPSVGKSVYFNRDMSDGKVPETYTHSRTSNAFSLIWVHFKASYHNKGVILYSFYYAIAVCFYIQITAYIQVLYISIDDSQEKIYNGYVDAILTIISAGVSLLAGMIHLNFLKKQNRSLTVLIVASSLQGIFVLLAARSQTLMACYTFYILYGTVYSFCITICATEIAKNLLDDAYGLVFGFNTLIALTVQTCVTLSVVSSGFLLSPRGQFQVYGVFYLILGSFYLLNLVYNIVRSINHEI